jgi:hypothetical protein
MEDHPILGVVLFVIGTVLVGLTYYSPNAPVPQLFSLFDGINSDVMSSLVLGHIFAFNGVLFVVLGCRKLNRARGRNGDSRWHY